MYLSRAAAVVSFFGALAIGFGAAYVAAALTGPVTLGGGYGEAEPAGEVTVTYRLQQVPAVNYVRVRAEDLAGVWTGTWDHGQVPCTLEIKRVEGNKFYGTLKEGEAEIEFAGTFDAKLQRVFFHETKVVRLGAFGEWSLGTNSGAFSSDGRSMEGTGIDKWGTYQWRLRKE